MSSKSSSEEDEDKKLMEAVDSNLINDSMFKPESKNSKTDIRADKLPSLRKSKDDDEQFNLFRLTPYFRNYVAKHLTKCLDKHLDQIIDDRNITKDVSKYKHRSRIKLFSNSEGFVKIKPETIVYSKLKSKPADNWDEKADWEKCKTVAVSPVDILTKKDTKFWSNRTKATVFHYARTAQGLESLD